MTQDLKLRLFACAIGAVTLPSAGAAATFTFFTDEAAFNAAASAIVVEDFNGPASDFAGNTTGGVIGAQTTLDVLGRADSSRTGLTGDGFFAGEVDSSDPVTQDGEALRFNTGTIFGFGLSGIQDNAATPTFFDASEVGVLFGGQSVLLSDILGLTDSQNSDEPIFRANTDPAFAGILSDVAFDGFTLVHGHEIANLSSDNTNEHFWIDALVLAPAPVPLPAGLVLLLSGLGALGVMRRRRTA